MKASKYVDITGDLLKTESTEPSSSVVCDMTGCMGKGTIKENVVRNSFMNLKENITRF